MFKKLFRNLKKYDYSLGTKCLGIYETEGWTARFGDGIIKIGCQVHSPESWMSFSDSRIASISPNALAWWNTYKFKIFKAYFKAVG